MLSFVQHLGRIRDKKQGKDAILHLLYVNDLSKAERKKFVESAKLSYTRLHENKLIGSIREHIMHCSPMALKQYVEEKGCRMVNLLLNVGGSRKPCGRCDRCRGSCSFTSNLIMRRKESDEYSELRAKFLKLKEILEEMCLVCKSKECYGTVCLKKGCYKCGRTGDADHSSSDCKGKCGGYLKGMPVCHGCLIWKDDILDHDECKNFDCKIGKRLLRLYQHLFRDEDKHGYTGTPDDNGKSFKEWMARQYSDNKMWYRKLFDLLDKKKVQYE